MTTTIRRSGCHPGARRSASYGRGFTMVELMVVIAILGILASMAAPSFLPIIERWRVRSAAEALQSTIYYGRSEAIKYGGDIVIAQKSSAGGCTSSGVTDWKCGWIVYRDINRNNTQDACNTAAANNECTLQEVDAPSSVELTIPNSVGYLTIDRWGVVKNNNSTTGVAVEAVAKGRVLTDTSSAKVCIPSTGRVQRVKGTQSC